MRIIAGQWRGRTLVAPQGDTTRPTTDRVRESLMSSLASARGGFMDAVVLDAFAGSGALGLEALSRGASFVQFFERDGKAAKALSKNLETFGVGVDRASLAKRDVLSYPPTSPRAPFDLVLLDPPYALEPQKIADFLTQLDQAGALASDVVVSYEHARSIDIMPYVQTCFPRLRHYKHKEAGKVAFDVFGKDDDDETSSHSGDI
ncbi:MAG: 16S rRNA (guanine(966)-N(2))-methyltransferase RsmD [Eggerthellaceae bacterium]|nr:16S rRNA (guanine(966)-N(2))-methyltransferase RsmD [Eggerthellaceae bacterium]